MTKSLLLGASKRLRASGSKLLALVLVSQLAILLIVLPVISWLFREALRGIGMHGLDVTALEHASGFTVTITLIMVLILFAMWAMIVQFTLIMVLLRDYDRHLTLKDFAGEVWNVTKKLFRPSSLPLVIYCFYVLPIAGYGFTSLLTRGIAVPPFMSGEIAKTPLMWGILMLSFLVLGAINLRLALTVPIFINTNARGAASMRLSFRLTAGWPSDIALLLAGAVVMLCTVVVAFLTVVLATLPTAITDKISPELSAPFAAIGLGIAQTVALLISGLTTAAIAAILLEYFDLRKAKLPTKFVVSAQNSKTPHKLERTKPRTVSALLTTLIVASIATTYFALEFHRTFVWMQDHPQTLAIAHRGFSDGGVENTISGLEAAAAVKADYVEIDIMETRDNRFVVMHDANLKRLAGINANVADLTLVELQNIEVTDLAGHSDTIPSFEEYLLRADELDMRLLIEIKLGGNDSADQVERIIDILESLDLLETHIYHSLDAHSVNTLKRLRPDLTVGLTMGVAGVAPPATEADMIVVEQWSASENLYRAARESGYGFFTWTVNDERSIKEQLRWGVDAIITDHPDEVILLRADTANKPGLLDQLISAVTGLVTFQKVLTN